MPLSDSDIFKAQIYRIKRTEDERKSFTNKWKELTETVEDANINLDDLFRYYTHIIRAKNNDRSKEIGLRKFYSLDKYAKLKDNNLIDDLIDLSEFWFIVNTGETQLDGVEKINIESQKYLHCLQSYPNEYWKYVTSVYYYKNKTSKNFISEFPKFLKKLSSFLFVKFIEKPTVNAIKDDIYQGCIDVFQQNQLKYKLDIDNNFQSSISNSKNLKIAKALILLQAYQNSEQNNLIPHNFEIEHIFPRIWQEANYNGWNKKDADEYLEKFGNKVAIEKKVNIQAGNNYFGKKKIRYQSSKIAEVIELSNYGKNDWNKEDIEKRENKFTSELLKFFKENLLSDSL